MLKGFEHVNLTCSDLDKTLHFYCDLIGFRLVLRTPAAKGGEIAFLACDGAMLEIIRPAEEVQTPARVLPRSEAGLQHLALTVDSVDAMYEKLSAAGVEFTVMPRDAVNTEILRRLCFCKDPDGIRVEFCEH